MASELSDLPRCSERGAGRLKLAALRGNQQSVRAELSLVPLAESRIFKIKPDVVVSTTRPLKRVQTRCSRKPHWLHFLEPPGNFTDSA